VATKKRKKRPVDAVPPGAGGADPVNRVAADIPVAGISIDDFCRLVVSMSRLLTEFNQLKLLCDAGLGLGDWAVLAMLAHGDLLTKGLSRRLGISVQRVKAIVASLAQDEMITVEQPARPGDKSGRVIKITKAGRSKLEAVNSEMKRVLDAALEARSMSVALAQMSALELALRRNSQGTS